MKLYSAHIRYDIMDSLQIISDIAGADVLPMMSRPSSSTSSPGRTHDPCHPVSIVLRSVVPSNRSQILHLLHFPRIVRAPTRTLDMFISKLSIAKMPFEPCRAHRTVSRIADPGGRDPFVIPRASPEMMSSRSVHNRNTLLSRVLPARCGMLCYILVSVLFRKQHRSTFNAMPSEPARSPVPKIVHGQLFGDLRLTSCGLIAKSPELQESGLGNNWELGETMVFWCASCGF